MKFQVWILIYLGLIWSQVVERDLLLQEKEKLYIELRNILARQPGPEVAGQVVAYARSLNDKSRQMKAMASELNMLQVIHYSIFKYIDCIMCEGFFWYLVTFVTSEILMESNKHILIELKNTRITIHFVPSPNLI